MRQLTPSEHAASLQQFMTRVPDVNANQLIDRQASRSHRLFFMFHSSRRRLVGLYWRDVRSLVLFSEEAFKG